MRSFDFDVLDYPTTDEGVIEEVFFPNTKDPWLSKLSVAEDMNPDLYSSYGGTEVVYMFFREHSTYFKPLGSSAEYLYASIEAERTLREGFSERLDELSLLQSDWDGFDASPVHPSAIALTRDLITKLNLSIQECLDVDNINPTADGTITLQWLSEENYFLIEIGKTKVVYFYEFEGSIKGINIPILYEGEETVAVMQGLLEEFFKKK